MRIIVAVTLALRATAPTPLFGQTTTEPRNLATLIHTVFGPGGLTVNSEDRLPDGSTHSAHFNSTFQTNFRQFNSALVSQLTSVPLASPTSGLTYRFDTSTGTFVRSTGSFGPLLAERAETIGAARIVIGYNYQFFSFDSLERVPLQRIPAVFSHDDFQLGGGRTDVVVTTNTIDATVAQFAGLITYGVTDRFDVSVVVPVVRTKLAVVSDATVHRFGTAPGTGVHFFADDTAPGDFGDSRQFSARASALGVGDLILRVKSTVVREGTRGFAAGLEVRAPSGNEEDLLGAGAWGVKPFAVVSFTYKRASPHINLGYQWNGRSVLAANPLGHTKDDLPDRITMAVGADVGVNDRLTFAVDLLADRVVGSPRLVTQTFVAAGPLGSAQFEDIGFAEGSYVVTNGAVGVKVQVTTGMLVNFNVRFSAGSHGLSDRVTPLVGIEYGF